jgi:hypothetical protein
VAQCKMIVGGRGGTHRRGWQQCHFDPKTDDEQHTPVDDGAPRGPRGMEG